MNSCGSPLVSVCCITYNHVAYIRQCIDGVLMQKTNFTYEIIINDDCSTDGTTDIIKEYALKFPEIIKPIFHSENQFSKGVRGMFATFCFPAAKGKYIALCEGDDYWTDPLKLQRQLDFLESHPDYSMCFHRATILSEINYPTRLNVTEIEGREYSADELFSQWIVPTASIVYRAEVNLLPLERPCDILNGDIVLVLKCCSCGKVRALEYEMSVYRMHIGGVTYSPTLYEDRHIKYPKHCLFIKRNFGHMLDSKTLNRCIAEAFWDSREVVKPKIRRHINKIIALCFDPKFILKKYKFAYLFR